MNNLWLIIGIRLDGQIYIIQSLENPSLPFGTLLPVDNLLTTKNIIQSCISSFIEKLGFETTKDLSKQLVFYPNFKDSIPINAISGTCSLILIENLQINPDNKRLVLNKIPDLIKNSNQRELKVLLMRCLQAFAGGYEQNIDAESNLIKPGDLEKFD